MVHPWRATAPLLLGLTLAAGCEDTDKNARNTGTCVDADGLQTCWYSTRTGSSGTKTVDINVNAGAGAFLLSTAGPNNQYLSVEEVIDPDGAQVLYWEDWYDGTYYLTAGVLPLSNEMQLNWPVRADDAPLSPGWWSVVVAAIDYEGYYQPSANIEVVTQVKQDASFADGVVSVRIVYVDGLDGDTNVTGATEDAVVVWRAIWAAYGLSLSVDYDVRDDIDGNLPSMSDGSEDIDDISAGGTDADITVVIGDMVGGAANIYGESGGIPGTLVEGERSAVAISWITNAGGDGIFSADDIQVYGETLAHEVGHYMGLFHPVDFDDRFRPASWDALNDTDECGTQSACDTELGENNMYPFPICIGFNDCLPQQTLSDGQSGVLHRHVGAL
jgi:hypothetical protein